MTMTRLFNPLRICTGTAFFSLFLLSPSLLSAQPGTGAIGPSGDTVVAQSADAGAASLRDNTPIVSADSSIMFFNSARQGYRPWARWDSVKKRYDEDIYFVRRSASTETRLIWGSPMNLGPQINSSHDDAIAAVSPAGDVVYFTSLKKGWEKDGGPYYQARLSGEAWQDVKGMGGGITRFFLKRDRSLNFRVYGASISPDGNDFYFATNVASSNDVHQIWVSRHINGEWSDPVNLGPPINNGNASYAPQIGMDGKTLFFASYQKDRKREVILASVAADGGGWQEPVILGIVSDNNNSTDALLAALADPAVLAMRTASTVPGTEPVFNSAVPEVQRLSRVVLVKVRVTDLQTGLPVQARINIEDLSSASTIYDASASNNGYYTVVLQPGRDYGISVNAPGYVFKSERYTIPEDAHFKEMTRSFEVEKLREGGRFVVNNIFFGYNADSLDNASMLDLDRLIALMKQTDGLKIEIGGHTDNIGSAAFNRQLSLSRADAVRRYLVSHGGIDGTRIETKGYGFGRPAADNDSEEGRKMNRRTEFKVLKMGAGG